MHGPCWLLCLVLPELHPDGLTGRLGPGFPYRRGLLGCPAAVVLRRLARKQKMFRVRRPPQGRNGFPGSFVESLLGPFGHSLRLPVQLLFQDADFTVAAEMLYHIGGKVVQAVTQDRGQQLPQPVLVLGRGMVK